MTDENNDELNADIPEDAQSPQQSTDAVPNGEVADAELAPVVQRGLAPVRVEGAYGADQMRYMSDLEHVRER